MTQALEHRGETELGLSPTAFGGMVAAAHEKALVLADIVEKAHLYAMINGRKYLNVEAWQIIGRAYGYTAKAGDVQTVRDADGRELGVMARSIIYDANGQIVGGAEGYCMNDEPTWADRAFYARAGMAQTRSISRGFRQIVSWVVVLAGYAPTPAEEMTGDATPLTSQAQGDLCPIHGIAFYQRGKMREPAHRLADDSGWCNKSKVVVKVVEKPTPIAEDPPRPTVDHWTALEPEARTALREMGYTTLQAATILGAPLDAWLAQDKLRTPAEAMRILREARAKQTAGG